MMIDDSLVGRAVVRCTGCGEERWYGYGACRQCGTFLPGAEVAREPNEAALWLSGVPFCAGRQAVAHSRTPMEAEGDGWKCPVCGENES